MQRKLDLRVVDAATAARKNILLSTGIDNISVARLALGQRYIALSAQLDEQRCTGFVALQQLVDYWLEDASLPAEQIENGVAQQFILDAFQAQGLPSPSDSLIWFGPQGFAQRDDYDKPLFLIQGGPFDLFLPELPAHICVPDPSLRPNLPISIRQSLGTVRLPASSLAGLAPGDVLRVPSRRGLALVIDKPIFSFEIHGDSLMIDTIFDEESNGLDTQTDSVSVSGAGISVEDLPIAISFLLSERTMRVAEIGTLQAGMTMPLDQPVPYVNIMAGSLCLARGELVRVGQNLGVEIIEVFPDHTGYPDETTP